MTLTGTMTWYAPPIHEIIKRGDDDDDDDDDDDESIRIYFLVNSPPRPVHRSSRYLATWLHHHRDSTTASIALSCISTSPGPRPRFAIDSRDNGMEECGRFRPIARR